MSLNNPKNNLANNAEYFNNFTVFDKLEHNKFVHFKQYNKSVPNIRWANSSIAAEWTLEKEEFKIQRSILGNRTSSKSSPEDYKLLSERLKSWGSNNFLEYGGKKDPFYLPVQLGYNYLITFPMYCCLIGLVLSDARISVSGAIEIEFSNRSSASVAFYNLVLKILAPIIMSVDVFTSNLDLRSNFKSDLDPDTLKTLWAKDQNIDLASEYDDNSFNDPNFVLNKNKRVVLNSFINQSGQLNKSGVNQTLKGFIKKASQEPFVLQNKGIPVVQYGKHSNNTRIRTAPIFKSWLFVFYNYNSVTQTYEKKAPNGLQHMLTSPLMLAFWLFGDGGTDRGLKETKNGTLRENDLTPRFSLGSMEAQPFVNVLKKNFEIIATIQESRSDKDQRIRIQADTELGGKKRQNYRLFYELVNPFIIQEMEYKLKSPFFPEPRYKVADLSKEQLAVLPKSQALLPNGKFNYDVEGVNQLFTGFHGHVEDLNVWSNCHTLIGNHGVKKISLEAEQAIINYLFLVFEIKQYLNSTRINPPLKP